jgi:hypothetical protein
MPWNFMNTLAPGALRDSPAYYAAVLHKDGADWDAAF